MFAAAGPEDAVTWPHLVTLRQGDRRAAIVLIPGQLGYPLFYRSLALAFAGDERVLSLQLPGVHEDEQLADYSIEQMAELFEPQLLGACPDGPIFLGGYSMGALLSLELAARLIRRGRQVPAIISLDGYAPQYPSVDDPRARLAAHLRELKKAPRAYLAERRTNLQQRLLALVDQDWRLAAGLPRSELRDARQYERHKRFALLRRRAAFRYAPRCKVQTALLMVRAEEPEFQVGAKIDPSYGWGPYVTGPIEDLCLPGTHRRLLESCSNRRAIADAIARHVRATWGSPVATPALLEGHAI